MLVLSRRIDETIIIGHEVSVTVVDIRGDKARLGVDAPISLPVHRKEVFEAITREHGSTPSGKIAGGLDPFGVIAAFEKLIELMPAEHKAVAVDSLKKVLAV